MHRRLFQHLKLKHMQQDEIKTLWLSLALVEHALAAGARNVLYKPVDMDELIATVEQGCR